MKNINKEELEEYIRIKEIKELAIMAIPLYACVFLLLVISMSITSKNKPIENKVEETIKQNTYVETISSEK